MAVAQRRVASHGAAKNFDYHILAINISVQVSFEKLEGRLGVPRNKNINVADESALVSPIRTGLTVSAYKNHACSARQGTGDGYGYRR